MQRPGVGRPASTISGGGGASPFKPLSNAPRVWGGRSSPFQPLSNAPCAGVGQATLDFASAAFDTASSCAPEDFQQSRLNREMCHIENHRQGLSSAPQDSASLHQVVPPQAQRQTGSSRRKTSTNQRDGRWGGQHVIQGGAAGAWGGQVGAARSWGGS